MPNPGTVPILLRAPVRALTRGYGQLRLDAEGRLVFISTPTPFELQLERDPRTYSIGALVLELFKPFPARLLSLFGRPRGPSRVRHLIIEAEQLRAAIPIRRSMWKGGPALFVGLIQPGQHALQWEEFAFYRVVGILGHFARMVSTGNPEQWAKMLQPRGFLPAMRDQALLFRAVYRHRLALALWIFMSALLALIFLPLIACPVFAAGLTPSQLLQFIMLMAAIVLFIDVIVAVVVFATMW